MGPERGGTREQVYRSGVSRAAYNGKDTDFGGERERAEVLDARQDAGPLGVALAMRSGRLRFHGAMEVQRHR